MGKCYLKCLLIVIYIFYYKLIYNPFQMDSYGGYIGFTQIEK